MQLECLLCMAYISFDKKDWQHAQHYFNEAFRVAKDCNESHIAEQCLCNSGIASGNAVMQEKQNMLVKTFYAGGAPSIHAGSWSDEDEDEEEEAEYGGEASDPGLRRRFNAQRHDEEF
mgnify:FL=1